MAGRATLPLSVLLLATLALTWSVVVNGDDTTMESEAALASNHQSTFMRRRLAEFDIPQPAQPKDLGLETFPGKSVGPLSFGREISCKQSPLACRNNKAAKGPDCCGTICTNKWTDINNCGWCGKKCTGAYSTCCYGKCTNILSDNHNCGRCGNKCRYKNKNKCQYGLCGYNGGF